MDTSKTTQSQGFNDQFIQSLQERLLKSSGVVSSDPTALSDAINRSIQSTEAGTEASKKSIAGTFDREISFQGEQAVGEITATREGQRGYSVQTAALAGMLGQSDKRIKDLIQRKEELLTSADTAGASAVSALLLKEYEMQQENTQKVFQNLLSLGGFAVQANQEERLSKAQTFSERSAIASLALKYGIPVSEGDTIDTITAKAMPFASEEQRLEIEKSRAEINRINAETSKALNGMSGSGLDDVTITGIAQAYRIKGDAVLSQEKDTNRIGLIINKAAQLEAQDVLESATADMASGVTKEQAIQAISTNPNIKDKAGALKVVEQVYKNAPTKSDNGFNFMEGLVGMFDRPTAEASRNRRLSEESNKQSLKNSFNYYKDLATKRELTESEKGLVGSIRNSAKLLGVDL